MPTIQVSDLYINGTNTALWSQTGGLMGAWKYFNIFQLQLFKGTMPTDFTGFTTTNTNNANLLVFATCYQSSLSSTKGDDFMGSHHSTNKQLVLNIRTIQCTAAGVATWFRISSPTNGYAGNNPSAVGSQLMGTVGVTGSGADLIISDNNISQGTLIGGTIIITIPQSYVY